MDSDSYSKQQLDDLFMDMIAYYDGDVTVTMEITEANPAFHQGAQLCKAYRYRRGA